MHLEFEIGVVWDRVEASERSSSEQCVVATAEGDDVEDQVFASEVVWPIKDNLQCDWARAAGLYTRYYSLKGIFSGFDSWRVNTHFLDCVLIEQIKIAATVHEDSRDVESIDN